MIHMHGPHTTAASCEKDLVLLTPIDEIGKEHIGRSSSLTLTPNIQRSTSGKSLKHSIRAVCAAWWFAVRCVCRGR